jgi:hypothetical protein
VPNLLIRLLLLCVLPIAQVHGADGENAQTAGDIQNKRNQACKNLKGTAREQCLSGYVGPEDGGRYGRDSVYTGKQSGSHSKPFKGRGEWTKPGRY